MRKYVYKKRLYIIIFSIIDFLGNLLSKFFRRKFTFVNINKILVVRLDHLGDIVSTIPVYEHLKKKVPYCRISVLTTSEGKEILQNNPYIDRIISFQCPWFTRAPKRSMKYDEIFSLIRLIRKENFDCALELRGDIRNILFLKFCGIKKIIGYGITGGGFLLAQEVPFNKSLSAIEKNLFILKSLGINCSAIYPRIYLNNEETEAIYIKNLLKDEKKPLIAYHLGAGTPSKKWPEEKFFALIKKIEKEFHSKSILIGKEEPTIPPPKNTLSFIGRTTIRQLIHLLRLCKLLVTNDSGPAHIAAAIGIPVVVIWSGTTNPNIWAPQGEKVKVVYKTVECQYCEKKICSSMICLKNIEVGDVFEAVKEMLR